MNSSPRVLLVAEHASAKFGGEAALPLHYYRVLRARGVAVWLVVHDRTRNELSVLYPDDIGSHIQFVPDTWLHQKLWRIGRLLPDRIANFSVGFVMRLSSQILQRRIVKRLVREQKISVIHQPMPVSPKEPSLIFNMGAPVIIGPMNGGMDYPSSFRDLQGTTERISLWLGRRFANVMNRIIPGKRKAALLLVANERTKLALPECVQNVPVEIVVENGVDMSLWASRSEESKCVRDHVHFIYMGRLVDWKAVDILISAFAMACKHAKITLSIIGDGVERKALEELAEKLCVLGQEECEGHLCFKGWLSQAECASQLREADALVLPSLMECGGAVVLEAMAMSLPVIATKWGGPTDYLDESCGILIEPSSRKEMVDGLANAMIDLASSNQRRWKMGAAARKRVETHFDWELKADRIMELYRKVEGS